MDQLHSMTIVQGEGLETETPGRERRKRKRSVVRGAIFLALEAIQTVVIQRKSRKSKWVVGCLHVRPQAVMLWTLHLGPGY